MIVIQKEISELRHPDYNPRQIKKEDFEQLKKSLTNFSAVEPAVINSNPERKNIIVGGNQRIRAAESLGWKDFPCVEISLSEEKEKELNVRLNKNTGEWDFDLLANNFDETQLLEWGFKQTKLKGLGFNEKSLDKFDWTKVIIFIIEPRDFIIKKNEIINYLNTLNIKYEIED